MRATITAGALLAVVLNQQLLAQTNTLPAPRSENRYLLIFENSRAMDHRADGVVRTVQDLLGSGLKGQFRRGDSLGVWTFNEQLYTGQFPLQQLAPETQKATTPAVVNFLLRQKCEKQPRFDRVMPALQRVITNSQLLTVILITTGTEEISGTPFDDQINATYRQWQPQQQTQRMPFVTVLRAVKGQITQYAVSPAPWPLEMPPLPTVARKENISQAKPPPPNQKPPAATLPPLIVSGKKPEPRPTATTEQNAAQTSPQPAPVSSQLTDTAPPSPLKPQDTPPTQKMTDAGSEVSQTVPPAQSQPKEAVPAKAEDTTSTGLSSNDANTAKVITRADPNPAVPQKPLLGNAQPNDAFRLGVYAVGAVFVLGISIGLVYWRKARARAARPISLITRSLERDDR